MTKRDNPDHPGVEIKRLMVGKGWNQRDLAWVAGMTPCDISLAINGKRRLSVTRAAVFGECFGIDPMHLLRIEVKYRLALAGDKS